MFMAGIIRPTTTYGELCADLGHHFRKQKGELSKAVRLVGILFARPTTPLAKNEVVPNLKYLDHRSGHHINFYCAGYSESSINVQNSPNIDRVSEDWVYVDKNFNSFRAEIEQRSQWQYSGGVDLILTNARVSVTEKPLGLLGKVFSGPTIQAYLDFSSALCVNLEKLKEDGAITSVEIFLESICRYAEKQDVSDPASGFSDEMGKQLAGSALKHLLLRLLPAGLREDVKKAFHFAVADISKTLKIEELLPK